MNIINKILIILIIIILQACSKEKVETSTITELSQKLEMISIYNDAIKVMEGGDNFSAAKRFLEAELAFPQSD